MKTRLTLLFVVIVLPLFAAPGDVPQWRGPNRDGVFTDTGLLQQWPTNGPALAARTKNLGKGMASVAVADGRVYTMGSKEGQFVICLDAATLKETWRTRVAAKGSEPRCTPTVDDGLVYVVSTEGDVVCVQANDGKEVWRKSFEADFDQPPKPTWQFSESPLVDGKQLIVQPGSPTAVMVALDKKSGAVIWRTASTLAGQGHPGAGYTGAVLSSAAGIRQYVSLVGKGAIGVEAKTGRLLWHYNRVANGTAVIPTPLVWDDHVFVSSGYGTGAALLKIVKADGATGKKIEGSPVLAQEVYFLKANVFQNHHGGMVRLGDYIYAGKGHNNGFPICLEWRTGKVVWENPRGPGKESAAVIAADGHLYFRYQDAVMALVQATPTGYVEKGVFTLAAKHGPSWPHPAIQAGKLYIRDQEELLCYDLRAK